MKISVTHIDTACIILDINGFRILTDPVLDPPGKWYHFGWGTFSHKSKPPSQTAAQIGHIDLVLLSHHQHKDNLDSTGLDFISKVPQVISTKAAARKIPNITGLNPWEKTVVTTTKVPGLTITATPAQHHPGWLPHFFAGDVIGFILEWEDQKEGALYISGDTVFFSGIEKIAQRFKVDIAFLHMGAVQFRYLTGWGRYTFNATEAIRTAQILKAKTVIPIHTDGWSHFKENTTAAKAIFDGSDIGTKTIWLESGKEVQIG